MRKSPPHRGSARFAAGFGLVELMVALVLGMLAVAAAVNVLLGQRVSLRFNRALSTVQSHARFALYTLERDLRAAGYTGCANPVTKTPFVHDRRPYGSLHILAAESAVGDWQDFALAVGKPRKAVVPDSANSESAVIRLAYVRDPGVTVTARASTLADDLAISGNPAGWEQGDILLVTNCRVADLFTATDVSGSAIAHAATGDDDEPQNVRPGLSQLYGDDARVFEPYAVIYYIRDSGTGARQAPTLYRKQVAPTVEYSQALVRGISYLTVRYGVDSDGTGAPEQYVAASRVVDWLRVVAVRVGFVARSSKPVGAGSGTLQIFDRRLDELPDDGYLRRVFTTTVALRNRLP